jgi:tripartite-type tricarboxylate transporter receptor subunit TctC
MRFATIRRALFGAALGLIAFGAPALAAYPDKPIRVIVPFPAGGGGDILARTVINKMAEQTGWTFVIENRAGAGGNIGTEAVAHAAPDGYTLAYGTNGTHGINQTLYKKPGFDAIKDFEPISRFTQIALLMVVNNNVPAKSPKELLDYIKANPGKVNIGSAGNGTTSHLASQMFATATGVQYQHIPYRGGGPAKTDLVSGQIQMMIEIMPSVSGLADQGQIRGLAVTTAQRWPLAPNTPTISETIVPGFTVTAWDGLFAPKGTPKEIIATLNAAVRKALTDPALRADMLKKGAEPVPSSPEEFAKFIAAEMPRWSKAVEQSGAKID